jgi:hypothetical protein
MSLVADMVHSSPASLPFDDVQLVECIEACSECAQTCTACADSCLGEDMVAELRRCVATCVNCADVCYVTGRVVSRLWGYDAAVALALLEACRVACQRCAEECERHAHMHEHCRYCAQACRRCEQACATLVSAA